ncbi:hypothetical protein L1987_36348 [Smallanthus sonchifolius]|uniref:Uncharacterized protein n=1 Tax=Smallanthus sonchifolius TaxID=185202 RepID=A0ACB9HEH5_9ASTR|nr:hypothetical protein L1987_36348 [Smallanthus sonchifolius]
MLKHGYDLRVQMETCGSFLLVLLQRRSKVGFTDEGKLLALDLVIYNNAGNSLELSRGILENAMYQSDNVYEIPNVRVNESVCFTDYPSTTAFRGFSEPQGMLITESWIQRVAMEVKKSPEEIREMNFISYGSILLCIDL